MQAKESIVWAQARPQGMASQVQLFHTIKEVQKMKVWLQNKKHLFSYLTSYWNKVERFTCTVPWNYCTQRPLNCITTPIELQTIVIFHNFFLRRKQNDGKKKDPLIMKEFCVLTKQRHRCISIIIGKRV